MLMLWVGFSQVNGIYGIKNYSNSPRFLTGIERPAFSEIQLISMNKFLFINDIFFFLKLKKIPHTSDFSTGNFSCIFRNFISLGNVPKSSLGKNVQWYFSHLAISTIK